MNPTSTLPSQIRRNNRCSLQLLLTIFILISASARAAIPAVDDPNSYPLPQDLSGVHFYLITVDVGDQVWNNFGHTALRMYDENTDTDLVFNWGTFDTSGGVVAFSYNFFKGIMNYQLEALSPVMTFGIYRAEQRTVWQDRINLTNPQKAMLYRRLMWNLEPANITYPYQYYFDNCTTRVRDYLDEALSGKLSNTFDGVTAQTFREQVHSYYESNFLIRFSLDILMNSNIDRPVSEWENMYLPLQLRRQLYEVRSDVAENGNRLGLLSDPQVIMEFPPPTVQSNGYEAASLVLLAPVLLLFLMLKKIPMSYFATHSRIGLKSPRINFRLLGLLGVLTAIFSGIYGALMLGSWFVSEHLDLHHNVNLLLFWPTDLLGLIVGLHWWLLARPWPMTHNTAPFISYYLLAHVVGMLVYGVVAVFDLSSQDLSNVALFILPGFFLYTLLIWLVGFEQAKPKNMFF